MMRVMLGGWGYGCEAVGTCADALRLIQQSELAAVLLDNSLPDVQALSYAARSASSIRACRSSFYPARRTKKSGAFLRAITCGANAFLSKPIALDKLRDALNTYAPL